jgi:hypothetical protein
MGTAGTIDRSGEARTHPVPVKGGDSGEGEVSQEISGEHWTKGYEILGPATTTAGVVMMSISAVEMLAGTAARAAVLYMQKGPGPWMMAALWGAAFTMPTRWVLEWGETQGRAISRTIMTRVVGANLPADGGGPQANN